MGFITTGTTVEAFAYATATAREYLFNSSGDNSRYITLANGQTIDRLEVTHFSVSDCDVNYNIYSPNLPDVAIPDISGENSTSLLGTNKQHLDCLVSPGDTYLPAEDANSVIYQASNSQPLWNLAVADLSTLPTVVTTQLLSFVQGQLTSNGLYDVFPKNYGNNYLSNGELIITLKVPTSTSNGYRMRIFFPQSGVNYDKVTIQFETSPPVTSSVISTSVSTTITPTTL